MMSSPRSLLSFAAAPTAAASPSAPAAALCGGSARQQLSPEPSDLSIGQSAAHPSSSGRRGATRLLLRSAVAVSIAGNIFDARYAAGQLTLTRTGGYSGLAPPVVPTRMTTPAPPPPARDREDSSSRLCRYVISDQEVRTKFERVLQIRGLSNGALYWLRRRDPRFASLQTKLERSAYYDSFTPVVARSAPAVVLWVLLILFLAMAAQGIEEDDLEALRFERLPWHRPPASKGKKNERRDKRRHHCNEQATAECPITDAQHS